MGGKRMNKKILAVTVTLLVAGMVLAPMVGIVSAGKGQTKMDFQLHLEGFPDSNTGEMRITGNNFHVKGQSWNVYGDFFVQVGTEDPITKEYLEYFCDSLHQNGHDDDSLPLGYWFTVKLRETISIYSSTTVHDETTLRGTLEILALGNNPAGTGATFTGYGTGEFEGVKIHGTTEMTLPPPFLTLDRKGTVMGW